MKPRPEITSTLNKKTRNNHLCEETMLHFFMWQSKYYAELHWMWLYSFLGCRIRLINVVKVRICSHPSNPHTGAPENTLQALVCPFGCLLQPFLIQKLSNSFTIAIALLLQQIAYMHSQSFRNVPKPPTEFMNISTFPLHSYPNSHRSALLLAARRLIYHDPRCVKSLRQEVESEAVHTVLLLKGLNDWNPGAYDWLGKKEGWLLFSLSGTRWRLNNNKTDLESSFGNGLCEGVLWLFVL